MKNKITVSIIYVYFNTPKEIYKSVESIRNALKKINYEIIIVNNNSPKKLQERLIKKDINVINSDKNLGFGGGCNLGAKFAKGEYLLFINPDTVAKAGSINRMMKVFLEYKKVGMVGPRLESLEGFQIQSVSRSLSNPLKMVLYSKIENTFVKKFKLFNLKYENLDLTKNQCVDVISGACMMMPLSVFNKIGGFDERFFLYFEEHDLCKRVRNIGYKVTFDPNAEIVHLVGRSLSNKDTIKKYFQKSRFEYSKKYFGVFWAFTIETVLRMVTFETLLILAIFLISLILNTYKQDQLMLLIGDSAHDFLAARDMILTGKIPMVGIPSSVVWLHQGPISVWLIGVAFLLSNFNPVAPAILFGSIGALTTLLAYYLAKNMFNTKVGIFSAILFACAPIIVVNARMPYHTSLIPFFTLVFFIMLQKTISNKNFLPLLFLSFGLLLLVELSNIVVFGVIFVLFWMLRKHLKLKKRDYVKSIFGFLIGVMPFIIYEFYNGPSYIKFPLWIINRIRLFVIQEIPTNGESPLLIVSKTLYQQISGAILPILAPFSIGVFFLSLIVVIYFLIKSKNKISNIILLTWIVIPLISFSLHSLPGTAYFTLLYPAISISIGYLIYNAYNLRKKSTIALIILFAVVNVTGLFSNSFYVTTEDRANPIPPTHYSFGTSWVLPNNVAKAIVSDAKSKEFVIIPGTSLQIYKTSIDPYKYLVWYNKGNMVDASFLRYVISVNDKWSNNSKIIYRSKFDIVERFEELK